MALMNVTEKEFEEVVLNTDGKPVLVDFWAQWCSPCKLLGTALEELAPKYEGVVTMVKVDIQENMDLATRYGVRNIPFLIVIRDGEVIETMTGFRGIDAVESLIERATSESE